MDLSTKQEIMLRYKGFDDLYQFFSIVGKYTHPADSRCSRSFRTPEGRLPVRVLAGAGRRHEEVSAAKACAFLQDADLARVGGEQALADHLVGPRFQRLLPQQAASRQGAGQVVLLGHRARHQARVRQVPCEGRDRVTQKAAGAE